jgi:hypothetical protein
MNEKPGLSPMIRFETLKDECKQALVDHEKDPVTRIKTKSKKLADYYRENKLINLTCRISH